MLPWLLGAAAVVAGKYVYDKLKGDDDDERKLRRKLRRELASKEQEEKESKQNRQRYDNLAKEYKTKLESKYDAEIEILGEEDILKDAMVQVGPNSFISLEEYQKQFGNVEKTHNSSQSSDSIADDKLLELDFETRLKNVQGKLIEEIRSSYPSVQSSFTTFANDIPPELRFKGSKKLDAIKQDIENLNKDRIALQEIDMYAKKLIREKNEKSIG